MVRAGLVILALVLVAPAGAAASEATLSIRGDNGPTGFLFYDADSGEANRLSITFFPDGRVRVEDSGAVIRPGENCTSEGAAVVCGPRTPGGTAFFVNLGDRDDETLTVVDGVLRGGSGNDTLLSRGVVDGGPGADTMTGSSANLSYSDRSAPVRVTYDGLANDGEPGEGDDVRGVFRNLTGGSGDDVLESPDAQSAFRLVGGPGDDHLIGASGDDELGGGPGDDVLEGNAGNDAILGGDGADRGRGGPDWDYWNGRYGLSPFMPGQTGVTITPDDEPDDGLPGEGDDVGSDIEHFVGTPGDDHLTGTDGPDGFVADDGNDTIVARGGDDYIAFHGHTGRVVIDPGAGRDRLGDPVDGDDVLRLRDGEPDTASCTPGTFPAIEADAEDFLGDCAAFLRFSPRFQRLTPSRANVVTLRARCVGLGQDRCAGELRLRARDGNRVLALGLYDVPAGEKRTLRVRLTKTGRRLLARERRVPFVAGQARGALVRRGG